MKIVFDATPLFHQKTGIGYYSYHLIRNMVETFPSNEYVLFAKSQILKPVGPMIERMGMLDLSDLAYRFSRLHPKLIYLAWRTIGFPGTEWFTGGADIFHGPNYLPLPTSRGKMIITIHDLSFLRYPEMAQHKTRLMFATHVPEAVRRAHVVLTDSEFSKREIIELLGVPEEKVFSIHLGVHPRFNTAVDPGDHERVRRTYASGRPYVLFVGTLEPRKNIARLIQAFAIVRSRLKEMPHKLVLVGRKGWIYEPIFETIQGLGLADEVAWADYAPEEDLPALYSAADCFVYPTLYEGFGLPPLEAMACGSPVISSGVASIPEVVGDAGVLVNPLSIEEIAVAMERVLTDGALRCNLAVRGRERAAGFTWTKTARRTMEVYRHLTCQ